MLDVVDSQDNVIGVRARGDIHRLGLMHRSVHILLFNSKGELFIQKRSQSKDSNPGLWDSSAAGHLECGESYPDCATRELAEELAIEVAAPLQSLFRLPASPRTGMEHCTVYHGIHDGPFQLQPEEIDEGRWVSIAQMDRRVADQDPTLTSILRLIWEKFRLGADQIHHRQGG
jgi:isopentenyl-diphosphate delta-isomerase type 1